MKKLLSAALMLAGVISSQAQDLGSTVVQDQYSQLVRLPRTLDRGWRVGGILFTNSGQTIPRNVDLVYVDTTQNQSNILVNLPPIDTNAVTQFYLHEIDVVKKDVIATNSVIVQGYTNGPAGSWYGSNFMSGWGLWSPTTLATNAAFSNLVTQVAWTNGYLVMRFIPDLSGSNWVFSASGR